MANRKLADSIEELAVKKGWLGSNEKLKKKKKKKGYAENERGSKGSSGFKIIVPGDLDTAKHGGN